MRRTQDWHVCCELGWADESGPACLVLLSACAAPRLQLTERGGLANKGALGALKALLSLIQVLPSAQHKRMMPATILSPQSKQLSYTHLRCTFPTSVCRAVLQSKSCPLHSTNAPCQQLSARIALQHTDHWPLPAITADCAPSLVVLKAKRSCICRWWQSSTAASPTEQSQTAVLPACLPSLAAPTTRGESAACGGPVGRFRMLKDTTCMPQCWSCWQQLMSLHTYDAVTKYLAWMPPC